MANLTLNTFAKFDLSEEETLRASVLTLDQKQYIQNQIAALAENRLSIEPEPNNYAAFIQTEAHLKGQIIALQYLLDCSAASEAFLNSPEEGYEPVLPKESSTVVYNDGNPINSISQM